MKYFSAEMIGMTIGGVNEMWTRCKLRNGTSCGHCRRSLGPRSKAWRPSTNRNYRSVRLCTSEACLIGYEGQNDDR